MNISRFLWLMLLLVAIPNSRGIKEDTTPDYPSTSPDPETTSPDYPNTSPEPETTTILEPSTTTPEPEPQCNISGKCKGSVISYSFTNDQTECLNQCKHYFPTPYQHNCEWITFDADTGLCELFEDCSPTGSGDCSNCISSEVRCETEADPDECYVPGNCQVYFILKVFQIVIFHCLIFSSF